MFGALVGKVFQQGKARQRYFLVGFAEGFHFLDVLVVFLIELIEFFALFFQILFRFFGRRIEPTKRLDEGINGRDCRDNCRDDNPDWVCKKRRREFPYCGGSGVCGNRPGGHRRRPGGFRFRLCPCCNRLCFLHDDRLFLQHVLHGLDGHECAEHLRYNADSFVEVFIFDP